MIIRLYFKLTLILIVGLYLNMPAATYADTETSNTLITLVSEATDRRNADRALFQRALASSDLSVQKAALLGLGRIGNPAMTSLIGSYLYSPQPDIRKTAAFALAISGDAVAYGWLAKTLNSETNPEVLAELVSGIGLLPQQAKDEDKIRLILPFLDHTSNSVRQAACDAMNYAWSMYRDSISIPNSTQIYKLMSMALESPILADHCLYALSRIRDEAALFEPQQLHKTIASASSNYHHKLLLLIVSEQQTDAYMDYILEQYHNNQDTGVLSQAATALAALSHQIQEQDKYQKVYPSIIKQPSSEIKIGFMQGLASVPPSAQSLSWLKQLSNDKSPWVKYRALSMLFQAEPENYLEDWITLFDDEQAGQATWEMMILQIVAQMQTDQAKQILLKATKSKQPAIVRYAQQIMADDESEETTEASDTAPYKATQPIYAKRLKMVTSRGEIIVQLLPVAPYTSLNFYQLAMDGYYDGVLFHRVIPNFVAQGGDPTGMGTGGPGYTIREELSMGNHLRGTIGMATSGKDTGGSQFFFNLKDNWHLDRRYTLFARVVSGLDVMDAIERGDQIISISEI